MQRFKDCLTIAWAGEKNAIFLTLRSRSNFSEISKQKRFHLSAWEWHILMNVLHPSLLKSFALRAFAAGILWKTEPWDFLHDYLQPNALQVATMMSFLEDDHCVSFFKLKFLIPALRHMFYLRKPSNIYGERDFDNDLEKYTFLWFKNRDFYFLMREKYMNSSKKSVKFFSSGYYFPWYISPLIVGRSKYWIQTLKKGEGSKKILNNYRGIFLASILSKILFN